MIDYTKGYTVSYRACFVNPYTWDDEDFFEIVSGSINRTIDALRTSASVTVRNYESTVDRWIRIYMDIDQNGGKDRNALFTGLATSPGMSYSNGVTTINLDCYSILKAIEDIILPRGYYIVAGENGVRKIMELLQPSNAVVDYEDGALDQDNDSARLKYYIVAENKETNLSMIEKILGVINYRLQIRGDGSVYLSSIDNAKVNGPVIIFSPTENDIIETSFNIKNDWFNCPNVFQAIYGDFTAVARDDDENSPLSTVNRGREIWMVEDSVSLEENESVGDYAKRRLKEEQTKIETADYYRRFYPNLLPDDIIRLDYPWLNGDYIIDSQTISLEVNGKTNENVSKMV